ncbi:ABC transporter substrate-binding protein [Halorussus amylolyticus]|uniref:ABC transporter substrate-binding protein n=1 Tax=Halorussus amylolyticus TaxID=1126242 RepID=UPI00104ACB7B|nr:ABC transporter substrate-binding protein [Halorussus amylolyticus]
MVNRSHSSSETSGSQRLSRRQILALASGAATAGLAGCSSGQDPDDADVLTTTEDGSTTASDTESDDSTTEDSEGGSPLTTDITIRKPVSWTPSDANVNPFATQSDFEYWAEYMWWESLVYPNNRGEPIWWLADDIRLEGGGCEVVIELSDEYTWWDGTPVTAQDMYTTQMITAYQEYGGPEETDNTWVLEDDYTLRNELAGPANPDLQQVGYIGLVAKHDYFESWLEQFEDASSEDAISSVAQDLNEHKISLDDLTAEGLGCGMWQPTQFDPTEVTHEKYEDHPRADWTNLDTFNWVLMADNQKSIQALQSGRFDFGDKMLTQVEQNDDLDVFSQFSIGGVPKLAINFDNKHLSRRAVRRAIAYVIDHEELVEVIKGSHGQEYVPHRNSMGMSSTLADQWLPDEFRDSIIDYGLNSQPDKATQVLEDAGYTKDGDQWVGPDGDAVEGLQYLTPPWPIYETIGKYLSPKLDEFGFDNKLIVPSSSGFWNTWDETYDFDMCNWFTNATHPASAFTTVSAGGLGRYDNHAETLDPPESCEVNRAEPELEQETTEKLNHPLRPEFPTEVGAMGDGGDMQTLYPFKWTNVLSQTQDEDEMRDLTEKLVWYHNYQLPHIGFYEETKTYWGKTDTYNFPVAGETDDHTDAEATVSEHTTTAMEYLVKGHISAKTE